MDSEGGKEPGLRLIVERNTEANDAATLRNRLVAFNGKHILRDNHTALAVYAKNPQGGVIGGLLGGTYWEWLYIDVLWVDEPSRRQGAGTRILKAAEQEAIVRGCRHAHVETYDFQAPAFYELNGYSVFGQLADFPSGHTKYFLTKDLALWLPK